MLSISFAIVALPTGIFSKKKRYEKSIADLVHRLHVAKHVAYGTDSTVSVKLERHDQNYVCSMEFEKADSPGFKLLKKPTILKGVDCVEEKGKKVDKVTITYVAKWGLEEPTEIGLFAKIGGEKKSYFID